MKDITENFKTGKIFPLAVKLIIPAVVAQLITFLYNVVDRMFVSRIAGIETQAMAALGVVFPITLIIQAFANLIGLGFSPKASMKQGEGDNKTANQIFNSAFISLVVFGLLLTLIFYFAAEPIVVLFGCPEDSVKYAVDYLQIYALGSVFVLLVTGLNPFITAQGHSIIAMITILLGAVLNVGLDPLFIYVFHMDVQGAALATILSQAISFIYLITIFFTKNSTFKLKFADMKIQPKLYLGCLFLGLSPFIMTFTESMIQVVFNICLHISTSGNSDYTAGLTIMQSALQLISLPLNGIGYGIAPFISYNYGRKDVYRVKQGIKYSFIMSFCFAAVMYTISMSAPQIYGYIFGASDSVMQIVKSFTPLYLMGTIMFVIQMTLQNVNIALGQSITALFLAVMRKVIILIPLCFILTYTIGYKGVFMSEGIADFAAGTITGIVIFFTFRRIFRKLQNAKPVDDKTEIAENV